MGVRGLEGVRSELVREGGQMGVFEALLGARDRQQKSGFWGGTGGWCSRGVRGCTWGEYAPVGAFGVVLGG